jgi:hypothetical protein
VFLANSYASDGENVSVEVFLHRQGLQGFHGFSMVAYPRTNRSIRWRTYANGGIDGKKVEVLFEFPRLA